MTRLTLPALVALLVGVTSASACSKSPPEPVTTKPEATAETKDTTAKPANPGTPGSPGKDTFPPGEIAYDAPPAWEKLPNPNPMRKATFKVPKAGGDAEDGELTVSIAGGGADANITRWAGQFGNATPKKEARTPNGLKVTIVEMIGTYASGGMSGAPVQKPGFMLLGAVVEKGEQLEFFKLTGPEKTVNAARKDFDAFVASFRAS